MSRTRRFSRLALLLPALAFAFFPQSAQAEVLPGLIVTAYEIPAELPVMTDDVYPVCNIYVEANINQYWGGDVVGGCRADWVMLHYQGFIQVPEHQTIKFWVASDDGGVATIGDVSFGQWQAQGCTATETGYVEMVAGEYPLDFWFFEAGGDTCAMLAWNIDDQGWEIVPEWAFTTESTPSTTTSTTTVPTTIAPATTDGSTTLPETSTSQTPTTTEPSTTSVETTSTVANTTTSIYLAPLPVWVPPATTTTEATTTTTTSEPPTETTETTSPPQTTQPEPSTTIPQTTVAQTSIPTTSIPDTTSSSTTLVIDTTTTLPPIQPDMSNQQILQQAINPSVVESLSTSEAEILFAELDEESVTADQAALIIQALDEAPDEVKKAFEQNVNVFSGLWSSYKMVGQTISVAERVTLVAVANTMGAATAVLRRRNGQ